MARIAAHHKPGYPLAKDTDYVLAHDWPDDCHVQWGGGGLVLRSDGSYRTAFFEAFPSGNAGGFIRGEGETIAEAEGKAFERWKRESACSHRWGRRNYTNGGAICHNCKAFKTVFAPIHDLEAWKQPLTSTELSSIAGGLIRRAAWCSTYADPRSIKWKRRLALRAKQAGIRLPPTPEPEIEPSFSGDDPYEEACMRAVLDYYLARRERLLEDARRQTPGAASFFRAFELAGLEGEARRRGLVAGARGEDA